VKSKCRYCHDNDTVIIVATDVAGNEAEKLITVSVKVVSLSTSVVWNGIGGDNKIIEFTLVTPPPLAERLTVTV
jgi:hypothetical protein